MHLLSPWTLTLQYVTEPGKQNLSCPKPGEDRSGLVIGKGKGGSIKEKEEKQVKYVSPLPTAE